MSRERTKRLDKHGGLAGKSRMSTHSPASTRTVGSFFRLLELDASEATQFPDTFAKLRAGELHGAIVHNVYRPEVVQELIPRLERHDPPFLQTWFPEKFRAFFYGENLNLARNLGEYFGKVPGFEDHLRELSPGGPGIAGHLCATMSALDGGRSFRPPPGIQPGQRYMFTTIRCHLPGGYIPAHVDNEQALRPSYAHLCSLIQPQMLSFVLALSQPGDGGALEVYNYRQDSPNAIPMNSDQGKHLRPDLSQLESATFRLPPGSMILVDSGRYLHRVTPVEGTVNRWTVCSFMALANDAQSMYCWG